MISPTGHNILTSAYAGLVTIEDMNASFSLWEPRQRSDDAYVGGADHSDGTSFQHLEFMYRCDDHRLNLNPIWTRLYKYLSRVNLCLNVLSNGNQDDAAKFRST